MSEQEQAAALMEAEVEEGSTAVAEEPEDKISGLTSKILAPQQDFNVMGMGTENLDNITWHDFIEYLHILDPVLWDDNPHKHLKLFQPGEVNIGLSLVYRQEWRPLGNQRGEIVRTVPLGPKQVEKVSTKIIRRTKVSRMAESLKSVESTTETSDTTKDSSEIINEAASNFGYQASVSGGYSCGFGHVKASAGIQGSSENRSKNLSSKLSETMQKTAGKIRSETRTVVSTESESSFEMTTASEIQNPNEEISITYVYSKLQRQYEIFTSLAEIHPVVMIPLPIPWLGDEYEKWYDWVRRHDWILAKVLLDDSFRDALTSISQTPKKTDSESSPDELEPAAIKNIVTNCIGDPAKVDWSSLLQGNSTVLQDCQQAYLEALKQKAERERQQALIRFKWDRFIDHLKENILHYYQAIWSQSDPQQQMLKLKTLEYKIPAKWVFDGKFGKTVYAPQTFDNIYDLQREIIDHELRPFEVSQDEYEAKIEKSLMDLEEELNRQKEAEIEAETAPTNDRFDAMCSEKRNENRRLCDAEIAKRRLELALSADPTSELKVLIDKRDGLISHLSSETVKAQAEYNATLSYLFRHLKISAVLEDVTVTGIREYIDCCESVVRASPVAIPLHDHHKDMRAKYLKILYPMWVESLDEARSLEKEIEEMVLALYPEIAAELDQAKSEIESRWETNTENDIAEIERRRAEALLKLEQPIVDSYAKEIPKRKEWLRKRLLRELKEGITFEGQFTEFDTTALSEEDLDFLGVDPSNLMVDIADLINPAGPIAYHGNYAIYYLKPEIQSLDLMTMLEIMKTPYLYYTARDREPTLVDPLLKRYLKDYQGTVPSMNDRFEMLEYVPDLRLALAVAQEECRDFVPALPDDPDPVEQLLVDDRLFARYYPEYLFRRDLTRRFVVDTNNIVLDIEPGRGSALESYKLAHRGIEVQKAVQERDRLALENRRMKELIAAKKLDARYWPEGEKHITFVSNGNMDHAVSAKPGSEETAPELTALPIITTTPAESASAPARIYGRVEKSDSQAAIKGATVSAFTRDLEMPQSAAELSQLVAKASAETSASGMFTFDVTAGSYMVLVSATGYQPVTKSAELKDGESKELSFTLKPVASSEEYIGNSATMELHKPDCPWVALMHSKNKTEFKSAASATKKQYNNCGHCMEKAKK